LHPKFLDRPTITVEITYYFSCDTFQTLYSLQPMTPKESHLRSFILHVEPKRAMAVNELSGRELRRVFYGYFRQPPGKKPERTLARSCNIVWFHLLKFNCSSKQNQTNNHLLRIKLVVVISESFFPYFKLPLLLYLQIPALPTHYCCHSTDQVPISPLSSCSFLSL
jgi:hypothetical protein